VKLGRERVARRVATRVGLTIERPSWKSFGVHADPLGAEPQNTDEMLLERFLRRLPVQDARDGIVQRILNELAGCIRVGRVSKLRDLRDLVRDVSFCSLEQLGVHCEAS
jgi:hypothetical protein